MMIPVHDWTRPLQRLRQWLSIGPLPTTHSAPCAVLPKAPTGRTRTSIVFTALSPVPIAVTLSVEHVPASCWFSTVRDPVSREQGGQLRREPYRHAHDCCEVCGGRGPEGPGECHEGWHDDDTTYTQPLVRLIALCPACQRTKHIGLAEVTGSLAEARFHLAQVTGWTEAETDAYLAQVWVVWDERSAHSWRLNLSWLARWQIVVQPKR